MNQENKRFASRISFVCSLARAYTKKGFKKGERNNRRIAPQIVCTLTLLNFRKLANLMLMGRTGMTTRYPLIQGIPPSYDTYFITVRSLFTGSPLWRKPMIFGKEYYSSKGKMLD